MPEKLFDKAVFSLAEVARSIQKTIAARYKSVYWVKAEMNKLNHYSHSGHCYPELVEKMGGKVIAEMRSVLWNSDYRRVDQRFIEITGEPLKSGVTILFQATIAYDPLYGMTLRIMDIDPAYSLGELERERRESISRLKKEGIFHANKGLPLPVVPKRLAIISVETSKGYADFLKILHGNPWGYRFEKVLFPALLQGDKSIPSIINQLTRIAGRSDEYDAVAIIRGGGGDVGLSSYNNYSLAAAIAKFPIPILTGIGHSTNETVCEMVAYKKAITPSELADFLIRRFHNFALSVNEARDTIILQARQLLTLHKTSLNDTGRYFRLNSVHLVKQQQKALGHGAIQLNTVSITRLRHAQQSVLHTQQTLKTASLAGLKNAKVDLTSTERSISLLDPKQVLGRGYSITRLNGLAVKSTGDLRKGDIVKTFLASGNMISTVNELNPSDE